MNPLPVMKKHCPSCPFLPGSPHAALAPGLTACAVSAASRICHSTGSNGLKGRTGKKSMICRGARDVQLQVFHRLGVIAEPTDEAWAAKVAEIQSGKE